MLMGVHVAITGILGFYKRAEAFSQICDRGGIPQETVTKETDILVVGYYRRNSIRGDKSNKRILAERYISQGLKIRIIREDEFLALLWGSPLVKHRA
jgi:DNA polymerase-3 subunit epsilon